MVTYLDKSSLKSSQRVEFLVKSSLKSSCRVKIFSSQSHRAKNLVKSILKSSRRAKFWSIHQVKRLAHPYCRHTGILQTYRQVLVFLISQPGCTRLSQIYPLLSMFVDGPNNVCLCNNSKCLTLHAGALILNQNVHFDSDL